MESSLFIGIDVSKATLDVSILAPTGVSIRGKTKVHFIANKKMEMLLHMAAINAITFNEELKAYYHRKTGEGKYPMSVLNAVRFKLICRIFAVVRRGEEYQKEYRKIAA